MTFGLWLFALLVCVAIIVAIRAGLSKYNVSMDGIHLSPMEDEVHIERDEPMPAVLYSDTQGSVRCPECTKAGHLRVYYYDMQGRLVQCQDCGYYWVAARG